MAANRAAPEARGGEPSEAGANVCLGADGRSNISLPDCDQAPIGVLDALRFDYLAEVFGYLASFAVSAQEAARRGNAALVELHARQAREALKSALEVRRELGSPESTP